MKFKSINPYNNEEVGTYTALTQNELVAKLDNSQKAFQSWRKVPLKERCALIKKAGQVLRDNVDEYAKMITSVVMATVLAMISLFLVIVISISPESYSTHPIAMTLNSVSCFIGSVIASVQIAEEDKQTIR